MRVSSCNRWPNLRQKIEGHLSLLLECRGLRCCCRETSPWRATRTSNSLVPRTPEPKSYIQLRKIKSCASWAFLVQINNQSAEIWRIFNIFYHSRRLALIFINEIQCCSVLKQSYREQYRNQMKFSSLDKTVAPNERSHQKPRIFEIKFWRQSQKISKKIKKLSTKISIPTSRSPAPDAATSNTNYYFCAQSSSWVGWLNARRPPIILP